MLDFISSNSLARCRTLPSRTGTRLRFSISLRFECSVRRCPLVVNSLQSSQFSVHLVFIYSRVLRSSSSCNAIRTLSEFRMDSRASCSEQNIDVSHLTNSEVFFAELDVQGQRVTASAGLVRCKSRRSQPSGLVAGSATHHLGCTRFVGVAP